MKLLPLVGTIHNETRDIDQRGGQSSVICNNCWSACTNGWLGSIVVRASDL